MSIVRKLFIVSLLVLTNSSCRLSENSSSDDAPASSPIPIAANPGSASNRSPGPSAWPDWLDAKIKKYDASEVWHFQHEGHTAYFLKSGGGDQYNPVFNAIGRYICSPSGGVTTDNGDEKCPVPALADQGTPITRIWSVDNEPYYRPPPDLLIPRLPPLPRALPNWLKAQVKDHDGQELWQFQHKGETTYFILAGCCDGVDPVFSGSGAYICSPSGGHTGGDDQCPSTALADPGTKIILVWPDPIITGEKYTPPRLDIPAEKTNDLPTD